MMRADERITADVVDQLVWDDRIDASKVAVVPTQSVSDDVIAKDVMNAIERNANVWVEDVEVSVEDGRVILDGVVPNGVTQVAAHNAARYAAGVRDVDDRLVVSYQM